MAIARDLSGNSPVGYRVETHIAEPGGSGGGSGDASAANQVLANTKLDSVITALGSTNTKLDSVISSVDGLETLQTAGNASLASLVTAAQSTATINVAADTSQVFDNTTAVDIKYASIAVSSSGNNSVIAAVSGKRFRVLGWYLTANAAVNAKFQSNSVDATGLMYNAAQGDGLVAPFSQAGWFETLTANQALNLNLSGAVAVGGIVIYAEIT